MPLISLVRLRYNPARDLRSMAALHAANHVLRGRQVEVFNVEQTASQSIGEHRVVIGCAGALTRASTMEILA